MSLQIRKKGNKNFSHIATGYDFPYGANDITLITDEKVKLRSFSGRVIFDREGYVLADVRIYDDTDVGTAEQYFTMEEFRQRLINLGYPFYGGTETVELTEIDGGTP